MKEQGSKILLQKSVNGHAAIVEQDENKLTLRFDSSIIQTQINTSDPAQLPLAGNRLMLAHLVFGETPDTVLLAGCGGGVIARWFNAVLPQTHGIAVESSADIIAIAREYFDFPSKDSNWSIVQDDVRHYLASDSRQYDFILFDIEENDMTPQWMLEPDFLHLCKQRLSLKGAVTFNIVAHSAADLTRALWPIRQVFTDNSYCIGNRDSHNIMITAFRQKPDTSGLALKAEQAEQRFGIEFSVFYQQLIKDNPVGSGIF